ncbi:MAG: hypothetical protein IT467_12400 [Dokdonella sp.]|nr:hypothetical protein [Dokdonella sp.]
MTPVELAELAQDLSFEKWTLDESLLAMPDPTRDVIDLRGPNAIIGAHATSSLSGSAVAAFRDRVLLPLLFGSAWKILDLIVERAWQAKGGPTRPQIAQKAQRTISHPDETTSIVCGDPQMLGRILAVYRNTSTLRHALVHRRVSRLADGGLVEATGSHLSRNEILAFCMLSRRLPEVVGRTIDARTGSELAWHVNLLSRVHGEQDLPDAYAPRPIDIVKVAAVDRDGRLTVDMDRAKGKASSVNGGFPFADLQIYLPDRETLAIECRLEDAPDGAEVCLQTLARRLAGTQL